MASATSKGMPILSFAGKNSIIVAIIAQVRAIQSGTNKASMISATIKQVIVPSTLFL